MKTIWKVSRASPASEAADRALRGAGIGIVEMDWHDAARALRSGEASMVVADRDAMAALNSALSHDLRTPLTAMAGWLHLIESGKLDEAGMKRALDKLRDFFAGRGVRPIAGRGVSQ